MDVGTVAALRIAPELPLSYAEQDRRHCCAPENLSLRWS